MLKQIPPLQVGSWNLFSVRDQLLCPINYTTKGPSWGSHMDAVKMAGHRSLVGMRAHQTHRTSDVART